MDNKKYVVYIHINKTNHKVYVGQTCLKPEYRWSNGRGYSNNQYFKNAINKYGWNGFDHVILKENLSFDEANEWEAFYIRRYNSTNCNYGYNLRFGGQKSRYNEEARIRVSMNHANVSGKNNPFYGKHHSDETKKILKIKSTGRKSIKKGIPLSKEIKQKMRENHANVKGKNNPRARKINQYDLKGNFIRSYWGCMEVKELCGFDNSGIAKCCKGKVETSYGYIWRYADE